MKNLNSQQLQLNFSGFLKKSVLQINKPQFEDEILTNNELEQSKKILDNYLKEYLLSVLTPEGEISEWYRLGGILEDGIISKHRDFVIPDLENIINYVENDMVYISSEKKLTELIELLDYQSLTEVYKDFLTLLENEESELDPFGEYLFPNEDGL